MPPPPPPPPAGGPPRGLKPPVKAAGGAVDRNALLSSIQKGKTLKKTVTNDRSAPLVDAKVGKTSISSSNGSIQGPGGGVGGSGMVNGGAPQLGGLFAGGMPKLRPTGRGRSESSGSTGTVTSSHTNFGGFRPPMNMMGGGGGGPMISVGKKPSAPPTPPGSAKPAPPSQPHINHHIHSSHSESSQSPNNGFLPPSPKPSSKSNPAPPPPPSNRKPSVPDRGPGFRLPHLEIPPPTSRPVAQKSTADSPSASSQSEERHPPLPAKPSFKVRPEPGYRGAPPRPPSSSKPNPPPKSPDLKPSEEPRRLSIDRSVSMREPFRPPPPQMRVGTSAESPAAPFRVQTNHREAPPIPTARPQLSKTVGRAAGSKVALGLRPPTDKPPKPPQRPVVVAPPPPSQPPPPPPAHRVGGTPAVTPTPSPGGKADVPLPPIPQTTIPPPPPERNESTRTTNNRQSGEFESKFLNSFKSRHQFPLPLTFNNVPKMYPSKSNALPFFLHQSYLDLHSVENEGKSQRRAPQPPTSSSQQPRQQQSNNVHHSLGNFTPHSTPPPLPPHAPLQFQMERKFYGTEASHC